VYVNNKKKVTKSSSLIVVQIGCPSIPNAVH